MVALICLQVFVLVGFKDKNSIFQFLYGHCVDVVHVLLEVKALNKFLFLLVDGTILFHLLEFRSFNFQVRNLLI